MNVRSEKRPFAAREVNASIEIFDLETGTARVVKEYPYCVEAPNWTKDGKSLVYNAKGRIFLLDLGTLRETMINTGFADRCNNDHVLSPDGGRIASATRPRRTACPESTCCPLRAEPPR